MAFSREVTLQTILAIRGRHTVGVNIDSLHFEYCQRIIFKYSKAQIAYDSAS
jgi:hypothetical protein